MKYLPSLKTIITVVLVLVLVGVLVPFAPAVVRKYLPSYPAA